MFLRTFFLGILSRNIGCRRRAQGAEQTKKVILPRARIQCMTDPWLFSRLICAPFVLFFIAFLNVSGTMLITIVFVFALLRALDSTHPFWRKPVVLRLVNIKWKFVLAFRKNAIKSLRTYYLANNLLCHHSLRVFYSSLGPLMLFYVVGALASHSFCHSNSRVRTCACIKWNYM